MASVNRTRSHCVNQMGKTRSKPVAARYGRGTAWARHAMCESAFTVHFAVRTKLTELLLSYVLVTLKNP